ncbi:MAG: acyltransferase [Bacteroidota bacterium]|nr:acyltransferase [Bacteroidota bacterium]MDP4247582.1 acyltransferase [Bacteroidota bacterium]MDP4255524.1 acyltransferase [Bacteroidota bacterium]MDP4259654.1 acyltransferase [Bacteroidota bacterium]
MQFKSIQLLRAIAALYVALYHLTDWWKLKSDVFTNLFRNGYSGVDLFFVISGFVVFQSAQKFPQGWRGFLLFMGKRLTRIYPIYWLLLVIFVGAGILEVPSTAWWEVCKSFLLLPRHKTIIGTTWTLQYEIYFYGLIALYVFNKKLRFALAGLFALSLFALVVSWLNIQDIHLPSRAFFDQFVFEFFLGVIVCQLYSKIPFWLALMMTATGLVLFFYPWHGIPDAWQGLPARAAGFGLSSAILLAGLTNMEYREKISVPRLIVLSGDASYCLYLMHGPLAWWLLPYPDPSSHLAASRGLLFLFAVSLTALAMPVHLYIEKPILNYLNARLWGKRIAANKP